MSTDSKKRTEEESMMEKVFKKLKKIEDHYYSLRKATFPKERHEAGPSANGAGSTSMLTDVVQVVEADGPDNESDMQKSLYGEYEFVGSDSEEVPIDEEDREIMGGDPSAVKPNNFHFHSDLASRWTLWITSGLEKEVRTELLNKYSREGNCPLDAPILNDEVTVSMSGTSMKRDKHFVDSQCLNGSAMSALGTAITLVLNDKKEPVDRNELLKLMCDAGKLMADLHHKESMARKAYILPGLDKRAKTVLGKIVTDKYLFGADLAEKLKSAKAVEKAGLDLKIQPQKTAPPKAPFKSNSVNWKSPPARSQKYNQVGNNQRGSSFYRSKGGRAQQENRLPEQTRASDEKSSKTK